MGGTENRLQQRLFEEVDVESIRNEADNT